MPVLSVCSRRGREGGKLRDRRKRWCGIANAAVALSITGLITACVGQSPETTPLVSNAGDSPVTPKNKSSMTIAVPVARAPSKPDYVIVAHGQSLNGIAYSHHVPPSALAAANHLTPPYKLKVGSRLLLPNLGSAPIQQANASRAAPPTPVPSPVPASSSQFEQKVAETVRVAPVPVTVPRDGSPKEIGAPSPPQKQALAALPPVPDLPQAPPVLAPRKPAAALPLPGETVR